MVFLYVFTFICVCVCDPYPAISVARLLLQGYKVNMDSPDTCTLRTPDGQDARVVRHGSLVSLCPKLGPFNEYDFAHLCNEFHAQFNSEAPPGLMATFNPCTIMLIDRS